MIFSAYLYIKIVKINIIFQYLEFLLVYAANIFAMSNHNNKVSHRKTIKS